MEDHGIWSVSITNIPTPPDDAQVNTTTFEVIVAKAPREVVFEGDQYQVIYFSLSFLLFEALSCQGGDVVFETGFGQNEISSVDIQCKAVECSPPPTFMWMIGRNLISLRAF